MQFVFTLFNSSNCTDGYLKIYLRGQETVDAYDKFDHELCGTEKPLPVVSDGPRLVMVFSSGELQGRGFKVSHRRLSQFIDIHHRSLPSRENTRSRRNTEFQARQRPMARAASPIAARRRKRANSIHHVILPTIHPTPIARLSFSRRRTSRSQSFSITLRFERTMPTRRAALMGESKCFTSYKLGT
jgi:hypothetical protein